MVYPITLAAGGSFVFVIIAVIFVIGRWVVNQIRESNLRARRQQGLGAAPGQSGGPTPNVNPATEHAQRELARQQYAERAERLRAQRMGMQTGASTAQPGAPVTQAPPRAMPPAPAVQAQRPQAQAQPQHQLPQPQRPAPQAPAMNQPRPMAAPSGGKLPTNRSAPAAAVAPVRRAPNKPVMRAVSALLAEEVVSYEHQHDAQQEQQRARVAQAKSPQSQTRAGRAEDLTREFTRLCTPWDLRRAVVMKEILDPPVSLRE